MSVRRGMSAWAEEGQRGALSASARGTLSVTDLKMGHLFAPAVSTIRINRTAIGRAAAELALDPARLRRVDLAFEAGRAKERL